MVSPPVRTVAPWTLESASSTSAVSTGAITSIVPVDRALTSSSGSTSLRSTMRSYAAGRSPVYFSLRTSSTRCPGTIRSTTYGPSLTARSMCWANASASNWVRHVAEIELSAFLSSPVIAAVTALAAAAGSSTPSAIWPTTCAGTPTSSATCQSATGVA